MPAAYTSKERQTVLERLREAGRARFSHFGITKTTVSELTRDAGIAKGTFYKFFASKEALYIDVIHGLEGAFRQQLLDETDALKHDPSAMLRRFFALQLEIIDANPLLAPMTDPEQLHALFRKLPPEVLAPEQTRDAEFLGGLWGGWVADGLVVSVDFALIAGLCHALLGIRHERPYMGDIYPRVIDATIDGYVLQLAIA
ncbi:MAG: AcrR family transcriptional regulator [Myxococcota bacterium]|jgi:AcrR family transcriptional regulator